jgi:hypothetical protein
VAKFVGREEELASLNAWYLVQKEWRQAERTRKEVVAVWRELAAATPDLYRLDLARSLSNLATRFSEVGRPAEALPMTEEFGGNLGGDCSSPQGRQ